MESTGVYWIPLYDLLASQGFEVYLVDPRQTKQALGRPKSDVLDCQWIRRLHSYGLLTVPEYKHYVPQNCRSCCASELIAAGVPTVVVNDFLGHGTVTTTEKFYINTKPAMRAAAGARNVVISDSCRTRRPGKEKGLVTFRHKSFICR